MNNTQKRNEKGFTMIELIIVVAIMGILAAILVPSFSAMSRKAKVSSDIRTIQVVQKQIENYVATDNVYPTSTGSSIANGAEIGSAVASKLIAEGLIEAKYFTGSAGGSLKLQTSGLVAVWDATKNHIVLSAGSGADSKVITIMSNIKSNGTEDSDWIQ